MIIRRSLPGRSTKTVVFRLFSEGRLYESLPIAEFRDGRLEFEVETIATPQNNDEGMVTELVDRLRACESNVGRLSLKFTD